MARCLEPATLATQSGFTRGNALVDTVLRPQVEEEERAWRAVNVESLVSFSLLARWFALIAAVFGFLLASLSFFYAHRTVEAESTDAERLVLARSQRSSEALSVAAQLAFMFVGLSFVSFPPAPPSSAAQVGPYFEGILRTAGFAFGAAVLALKSFLGMQIETQLA